MINWLSFDWGPMKITCDQASGKRRLVLPNGINIIYDTLENFVEESGERYLRIKNRRGWTKMYSGRLVENAIQGLARVVVSQALIRLKRLGYRCIMTKHDSLWLLIPKDDGRLEEHKKTIIDEMSRTPDWLPGIPLAAEFKTIGERYA
jgi:DNA polymerase